MANSHSRDGVFNPTSPHSSSGVADSFKGTPDTRLTAFSPEDGSTRSLRAPQSIGGVVRESGPIRFNFGTPDSLNLPRREPLYPRDANVPGDPFVILSGSGIKAGQKLSPTASCFAPSSTILYPQGSEPEMKYLGTQGDVLVVDRSTEPAAEKRTIELFAHAELSTDLGISRCLMVAPTSQGGHVQLSDVEQYVLTLGHHNFHFKGSKQFQAHGNKVYVRFINIRDACLFIENVQLGNRNWVINYIHPREFSQVVDPTSGLITAHEGQLAMAIFAPPSLQHLDRVQLVTYLQELLVEQGDLFAFKENTEGVEGSVLSAVVEYCDNDVSLRAVAELQGKVVDGLQICMTLHRPDIPTMASLSHERLTSPMRTPTSSVDIVGDFQRMSIANRAPSSISSVATGFVNTPTRSTTASEYSMPHPYGMMPLVYHGMPLSPPYIIDPVSPRVPNMFPAGNYSWVGSMYSQQPTMISSDFMTPRQFNYPRGDSRRSNAIRVQRSPYQHHNVSGQHNHVDVDRIREGIDVRTTVDQAMLKRIVDESSWGKYDFMYLRIDFANDCNVGYAFINFVDPLDIIDFVNKRGNQRWNCFKSDKVAEISYATIQGKDCLVQKFRNSSVMLEAPHYRPKLYYTINGPRPEVAGHEEEFPVPDNQSKMKRSCENAEHVGLFTPNAGQHYRDEQRRRRSQFDRGTRLAAMEEFDYPTFHTQHSYSPQ
ncbi:hypothetical protein TruAng_006428 [Truncatella angustata]|nr:hypothetical protein TruAng_006428 [Truncatella angustata]